MKLAQPNAHLLIHNRIFLKVLDIQLTDPLRGKLSKVSSDEDRVKALKALEKACKRA